MKIYLEHLSKKYIGLPNRVSWKKQKWDLSINPKFFSCLMVYRSWGKKSFSDSDMFSWVELDPKFGILAFSAIFVLFFWVAKNLIYIDNAFNGYSYLKSTRKGLSDGTLMLKKEYRLARWNCDWKSYTFPKKYPPARENDQNSTKSTKWLKITFRGSKMVPKVSKWGFWGGICIVKIK